jgi:hypothetical protein
MLASRPDHSSASAGSTAAMAGSHGSGRGSHDRDSDDMSHIGILIDATNDDHQVDHPCKSLLAMAPYRVLSTNQSLILSVYLPVFTSMATTLSIAVFIQPPGVSPLPLDMLPAHMESTFSRRPISTLL